MAPAAVRPRIGSSVGDPPATGQGRITMNRYERREHCERLCQLRDRYAQMGPKDTTGVITIEAMMERAIRLLERPTSALIALNDGTGQADPTRN
jgi:hypothetical protein